MPRSSEEAALRLAGFYATIVRSWIEASQRWPEEKVPFRTTLKPKELAAQVTEWVNANRIDKVLSPREKKLFKTSVGKWLAHEIRRGTHMAEPFAFLAWSLGVLPKPPAVQNNSGAFRKFSPARVFAKPVVEGPFHGKLRPLRLIRAQREIIEVWVWRERIETLITGGGVQASSVDALRELATFRVKPVARRHGLAMAQNDLAVGKLPYWRASSYGRWRFGMVTEERLRVANWLLAEKGDFDQTRVKTELGTDELEIEWENLKFSREVLDPPNTNVKWY